MQTFADQLTPALNQVTVPDLWQQEAVAALRAGKDVVVQAPTGAGKTLIFELWSNQGKNRGQAIYTVPTRALANDKLAEWRARGWDVGIATGDLAENLQAPMLVATLETQKNRLIQGDGPALLVVDEYQMFGDPDRGLNYELAIALAPPQTQLLLLSGSVANPQDVVKWLARLGRQGCAGPARSCVPCRWRKSRPNHLNYHVPSEIRAIGRGFVAKALAEDLGPILDFRPAPPGRGIAGRGISALIAQSQSADVAPGSKATASASIWPKCCKSRVAYHHSGLSYAARAGVIEPLAKAGQLRVVVATMGLAAGINFSLRSVALAGESYRRDNVEQPLRPDEILQMFGRAGRRGIDEIGFVLVTANELRLRDGYAAPLVPQRHGGLERVAGADVAAAAQGRDPFTEAVRVQERLFTTKPIFLGVEESLKHPDVPCGLKTDAERARHVRKRVREMLNSQGEWELTPPPQFVPLREVKVGQASRLSQISQNGSRGNGGLVRARRCTDRNDRRNACFCPNSRARRDARPTPVLSEPAALEKVGHGTLCVLSEEEWSKSLRPLPHGRRISKRRSVAAGQMDSPPDELERTPSVAAFVARENCPFGGAQIAGAKHARRAL